MTEQQHLQRVVLEIAKDLDRLCRENNIDYYLGGGGAIGAIRHHGFIPWDDDLDFLMTNYNYRKFIKLCREKLDPNKYYIQEGLVDWPMPFTKIRLRDTHIEEYDGFTSNIDCCGIFLDIFKLDNLSDNPLIIRWQYICAKIFLAYCLSNRTFNSTSLRKRILIYLTFPLKVKFIRNFILKQVEKYNIMETANKYGCFWGRTRFNNSITDKDIYGKPLYVRFEDTELPVPEQYDKYLTQFFGDYMKLPPIEQQVGLHITKIDFGKY